jgi:hypothetical protein
MTAKPLPSIEVVSFGRKQKLEEINDGSLLDKKNSAAQTPFSRIFSIVGILIL